MNIQTKLFGCVGAVLALGAANAAYSTIAVRDIRNQLNTQIAGNADLLHESREITLDIANMRSAMRGITVFTLQKNPALLAKAHSSFDATVEDARKTTDQMAAAQLTPEDRAAVTTIRGGMDQWSNNFQHFSELCTSGKGAEANAFVIKAITPVMDTLQKTAAELGRASSVRRDAGMRAAEAVVGRTQLVSLVLGLIILISGIGALAMVGGMVKSLRRITKSLLEGAEQVDSAASQVASASQSLSEGSTEQAASLEETSASTEEISAMARKNTENSRATAAIATESDQKFVLTNRALSEMVAAMNGINTSSGKISKIIKVIDEIAFQTNILALNAAVEAARAGQAGMGFAVVADEVRNLAQRSAQAAKDTSELIEESMSKSSEGKTRVDAMAKAIHEITDAAMRTKTLVDEVSVGSEEQVRGIEHIAQAITQMEQVTQQTAAAAEESAAAAAELSGESQTMHHLAEELTTMVG